MNKRSAPSVDPLDLSLLAEQTGGDRQLERQVLQMFLSQLPCDLTLLRQGSETERLDTAHRIVGSARAVGALSLADAATAIRTAGRADRHAVGEVEAAFALVREFIADYLSR